MCETKDLLAGKIKFEVASKRLKDKIEKELVLKKLTIKSIDFHNQILQLLEKSVNEIIEIELDSFIRLEITNDENLFNDIDFIDKREELLEYGPIIRWVSRIPNEAIENPNLHKYHFRVNMFYEDALT